MVENQDRPDDAEHHVGLEPRLHGADESDPAQVLACGVEQQQQH